MERYNYMESVKAAVKAYIIDNYGAEEIKREFATAEEFAEALHDEMWTADEVTGNGSGSYTFSTYKAEENLAHNWDLIEEVAEEFGTEPTISAGYDHGAEWWDVSIRCYLLPQAIAEVLDEMYIEYGAE